MADVEQTYTLDEAARVFRLRECANHGHSWQVIQNMTDGPMRITCDNCGWSGSVEMDEKPRRP